MNGPDLLAAHSGHLKTAVGACWPGHRAVFRGQDLHRDLAAIDWMELYVFGITGHRYSPEQVRMLHGIWILTSYPDARLWNNRVAALAANTRSSSVLGLSAAIATTEAAVFGGGPGIRAIDFFLRAGRAVSKGTNIAAFVTAELSARRIYGYGRPINNTDERLPSLISLSEDCGLADGLHYRIAFQVEKLLVAQKPVLKMNYAALTAALAADMGFTPRQYHLFNILKTLAGIPPCIVEAEEKPAGTVFATPCHGIHYTGLPPRPWLRQSDG